MKKNQYLLVKENMKEFYSMYIITAGHLEQNELLIDAVKCVQNNNFYSLDLIKG